ncbi:uncharacterized protein JN550_005935 [Neoarthrinium moseri]|uniref:uncharacterized protein n=1 Tax=Neoarthrinium moseri TaxID=1658444 RepID=UPI001FDC33F3|nr:uncharacterized protein JN550_005935 [Neoarthrinium moseri]KAI1869305.1 hypothetical protein JN550_005935 [Neoarthrinium moseri]
MAAESIDYLPLHIRVRSSRWFTIASVAIAVFTDTFLYGHAPHSQVILTAVAVGLSGAGNLVGSYHIRNRRTSLLLGLTVFIAGTAMIWAARHFAILSIGRLLQGLASAAVWVVGLALLADTVGRDEVPVAMGYVNVGFSGGTVLGPIAGGLLYSLGGFDAVMGLAVGLLCLDILLRILIIEKKDLPSFLSTAAVKGSLFDQEASSPLLRESVPSYTTCAERPAVCNGSGGEDNITSAVPEIALRILIQSRRLLVSLGCTLVQAITMTAFEVTLPLHLYETPGYTMLDTGLVFIPIMVPALLSPVIGHICTRLGNRPVVLTGYLVCGTMLILLRLHTSSDTVHDMGLHVALAFIGLAMCMVMTPVLSEVFAAVEDLEREKPGRFGAYGAFAQAYGLFELFYAAGSLLGPVLAGWLKTQFSWASMTLGLGALNLITIAVVLLL